MAGCMAHPLAETSRGYDGRDQVGFFNHTCCCRDIGCEASQEFRFLSKSALKIFDKAVGGMSWYEYSRHSTSVLGFVPLIVLRMQGICLECGSFAAFSASPREQIKSNCQKAQRE